MSALEALEARVLELEAQLAARTAPRPAPPAPTPFAARKVEGAATVPLRTLLGAHGLPREARALWRLLAAVALAKGAALPGGEVPRDWLPALRALGAARARGLSWREALGAAGLEVPSAEALGELAGRLPLELEQLWAAVVPLAERAMSASANPVVTANLLAALRALLGAYGTPPKPLGWS